MAAVAVARDRFSGWLTLAIGSEKWIREEPRHAPPTGHKKQISRKSGNLHEKNTNNDGGGRCKEGK